MEYAGFWLRFIAYLFDSLIIGLAYFLFVLGLLVATPSTFDDGDQLADGVVAIYIIFVFVFAWLYYTLMESSSWQATLGKRALELKVTDMSGNRIGFGRANARYFCKILSKMILYIGFIMAAFTEHKQGLHDVIAKTLVVKNKRSVELCP